MGADDDDLITTVTIEVGMGDVVGDVEFAGGYGWGAGGGVPVHAGRAQGCRLVDPPAEASSQGAVNRPVAIAVAGGQPGAGQGAGGEGQEASVGRKSSGDHTGGQQGEARVGWSLHRCVY